MIHLLISILAAITLFSPLVSAGDGYTWPETLSKAKLLGLPTLNFNQKQSPSQLGIVQVIELTKEKIDYIEDYILINHKHASQDRRDLDISVPHVGQFSIGALKPKDKVKESPLIYNYINLNSNRSFNEYILEGSAIAHNENSELSKNFKLTMVEYRDEANKRKIMYVNPFSRKLLHLMKMNDEIRKLDARIIYELTDNNLDMWYNFSKNGKIPWYKINTQLWSKYCIDKISYPFIDFSGIRRDGDNDSFDILKDGDKAIADFDDWMSNEASSSHS